jgi:hypothetical protein
MGIAGIAAFAAIACGGDDSSDLAPGAGGAGDATIDGTTVLADGAVIVVGDGGLVDTAPAIDTAPPPLNSVDAGDIPEGGLHVDPGVVKCGGGGATCNAFAGNQCCIGGQQDGAVCLNTGVACATGASSFECNESADCYVGTVCCGTLASDSDGGFVWTTRCQASCAAPLPQFCRTNGECGAAADGGCVVQTCPDGHRYEICGAYTAPADSGLAFACTPN